MFTSFYKHLQKKKRIKKLKTKDAAMFISLHEHLQKKQVLKTSKRKSVQAFHKLCENRCRFQIEMAPSSQLVQQDMYYC